MHYRFEAMRWEVIQPSAIGRGTSRFYLWQRMEWSRSASYGMGWRSLPNKASTVFLSAITQHKPPSYSALSNDCSNRLKCTKLHSLLLASLTTQLHNHILQKAQSSAGYRQMQFTLSVDTSTSTISQLDDTLVCLIHIVRQQTYSMPPQKQIFLGDTVDSAESNILGNVYLGTLLATNCFSAVGRHRE